MISNGVGRFDTSFRDDSVFSEQQPAIVLLATQCAQNLTCGEAEEDKLTYVKSYHKRQM